MVVLEAYVCAKPVVALPVSSLSEIIIHGSTSLLLEPGSVQDLANKVNSLVAYSSCRRSGRETRKVFYGKIPYLVDL